MLKMSTINIVSILAMLATNNMARAVNYSRKTQRPIDPINLHFDIDSTSIELSLSRIYGYTPIYG